jgi:hypothetical protein
LQEGEEEHLGWEMGVRTLLQPFYAPWSPTNRTSPHSKLPFFTPDNKTLPDGTKHRGDLFSLLGPDRPDYRWLIVGPKFSGSAFHIDPNCTHAWNMPVIGRKLWVFYPPGVEPPGVRVRDGVDEVVMPVSLGEWVLSFWDEHKRRLKEGGKDGPLEVRETDKEAPLAYLYNQL